MIGIDIRELSSLKILQPICEYFISKNIPYALYNCDFPRGAKEYNRASLSNIKLACNKIVKHAKFTRAYADNKSLFNYLKANKIRKFVGVELSLCYGKGIVSLEKHGDKAYSILYLTDDMWRSNKDTYEKIHRTYFTSEFLMKTVLKFSGAKYSKEKHKCFGTPLFDQLKGVTSGNDTLVLLPNVNSSQVAPAFGSKENFINIIKSLSNQNNLIFKTRKKQWLPSEITRYAKEIIQDGTAMYPSAIVGAFGKCKNVVMFYSSGVYESVVANKYVINIPLPLNRWVWDKNKMNEYFSKSPDALYNYNGVVKSVEQKDILLNKFDLSKTIDLSQKDKWVNKFMTPLRFDSAAAIAKDILK